MSLLTLAPGETSIAKTVNCIRQIVQFLQGLTHNDIDGIFDSRVVAAAASISASVNFVRTAGYATAGDGGGALYKRASGTTPGGFQSADGQWWQIVPENGFFFVRAFGAVGDGTTDDTTALQAAIDAASAAGGGTVFLSAGFYKITTALSVTSNVSFLGAGPSAANLFPSASINCINFLLPGGDIFCKDLGFFYPSAATAGTSAITLSCSVSGMTIGCLFENLAFRVPDTCISIDKS